MKVYHLNGPAPLYTNSYLLISEAKHAVIIDPVAEPESYNRLMGEAGAALTKIFWPTIS